MSVQMQKSTGRSRRKRATSLTDSAVLESATDPEIVRMAIVEALCRDAERHSLIEEAAYYRAEKRGFMPGHELEDWLAAEEEMAEKLRLTVMCPSSSGSVS
jgi:hypothetical protein